MVNTYQVHPEKKRESKGGKERNRKEKKRRGKKTKPKQLALRAQAESRGDNVVVLEVP